MAEWNEIKHREPVPFEQALSIPSSDKNKSKVFYLDLFTLIFLSLSFFSFSLRETRIRMNSLAYENNKYIYK